MVGWVKIHRELLDWQWFSSSKHLSVFIYLLLNATHKETKWRNVTLNAGQLISGRNKISAETGINSSSVGRILADLKRTGELNIKSTSKFSIITIVYWEKYQNLEQQTGQQLNNKRTATEQQLNTFNNVKNVNNEKNNKKKADKSADCADVINYLNTQCYKKFTANQTHTKLITKVLTTYSVEQCKKVIDHIKENWTNDPFWSKQLKPKTIFAFSNFENYYETALNTPSIKDPLASYFEQNQPWGQND